MVKGFTLIELVIVIVLLGVVSIYVAPKITLSGFKELSEVTKFRAHIRHAQHNSMTRGGFWGVGVDSTSKSYILYDNNTATNFPDEKSSSGVVSEGISLSSSEIMDNRIYFDNLGRPVNSSGALLTSTVQITVNGKVIKIDPYGGGIY